MAELEHIEISEVRQQAEEINSIADEVGTILSNIDKDVSEIGQYWRGSSANEFVNAWENVNVAFDSYYGFIRDLSSKVKRVANEYDVAENTR